MNAANIFSVSMPSLSAGLTLNVRLIFSTEGQLAPEVTEANTVNVIVHTGIPSNLL